MGRIYYTWGDFQSYHNIFGNNIVLTILLWFIRAVITNVLGYYLVVFSLPHYVHRIDNESTISLIPRTNQDAIPLGPRPTLGEPWHEMTTIALERKWWMPGRREEERREENMRSAASFEPRRSRRSTEAAMWTGSNRRVILKTKWNLLYFVHCTLYISARGIRKHLVFELESAA